MKHNSKSIACVPELEDPSLFVQHLAKTTSWIAAKPKGKRLLQSEQQQQFLKKKIRLQAFITRVIKSLIKHEFLSTQKGHASCSSFWNVCRFGTFPSIKDIYFDLCERAWTWHCFHYQLCILETTREHVKSKKIHWLLQHLPSCLPYTVRNDQFLNSLYWERIESFL